MISEGLRHAKLPLELKQMLLVLKLICLYLFLYYFLASTDFWEQRVATYIAAIWMLIDKLMSMVL